MAKSRYLYQSRNCQHRSFVYNIIYHKVSKRTVIDKDQNAGKFRKKLSFFPEPRKNIKIIHF